MHTKHHTRGIVLGAHDRGEADRVYALLTPDFGKIYAHAQGVRRSGARHKPALQTLSKASVSLVRGKTGWRVTNAAPISSLYTEHSRDAERFGTLVRVLKLAHRLVAGEGNTHEVFSILESFADALGAEASTAVYRDLELLVVLRMLNELGYIKPDELTMPFIANREDFSLTVREALAPHRRAVLSVINHALEASQL